MAEVNKTFEQILGEIESEQDPTKAKEILAKVEDEGIKKQIVDALNKKGSDAIDQIAAAREAKRKQEELAADAEKRAQGANLTFEQRMRKENSEKALNTIFQQLGVEKEEEKQSIRKEFDLRKPEAVTVENLIEDAKRAAVAALPDRFLGAEKRIKDLQSGAADINSVNAGGFGSSEGSDEGDKKYSKEARELARKSGVSLDDAQAYIDEGGGQGVHRFELGRRAREKAKT